MKFTPQQLKVIETEQKNILVSAAAGSGKTAVLVQRILERISRQEQPIDIDRILIVTFTKAAAAEMKERISKGIQERLLDDADNVHLQRQTSLIHHAMITTIDSFCLQVLRSHFHKIDLDPSFRVADEGELKLLKADVMGEVLEQAYAERNEDFLWFVECYAPKRSDQILEDYILRLYEFSMSHPFPDKWLLQCEEAYCVESIEELEEKPFMQFLFQHVQRELEGLEGLVESAINLASDMDGPYMYIEALESDRELIWSIRQKKGLHELFNSMHSIAWQKLSSKRDESVSVNKRELVKQLRSQLKDSLTSLKKQYVYAKPEQMLLDMQKTRKSVRAMAQLTIQFHHMLLEAKKEKNIVDFGDLEHFALQILLDEDEKGQVFPSAVAGEYRDFFEEIMIDEYQDSNLVQEYILTSMSKENNLFMVGDVKQSIYKFRMARPELFMEKYAAYPSELTGEGRENSIKIELRQNFRSRQNILESVNYLFQQLMVQEVGGIHYDEDAALYYGAAYPEENADAYATELLLVRCDTKEDTAKELLAEEEGKAELSKKQLEAKAIAMKIKEMIENLSVYDKKTETFRNARYADMVILLQTNAGWDDVFREVLTAEGIPVHTSSRTGYFSTIEIRVLLHYLQVLDNPLQDIALAAVLKSVLGQFKDEELAVIRAASDKPFLYEALCEYVTLEGKEPVLIQKIQKILEQLNHDRQLVPYTPVHELMQHIIRNTDYDKHMLAMPAGEQRLANLYMLLEKASAFEKTSYKGLFHFIRYIEQLKKYDVDFGEAEILGEFEDTVRIMSIHKSKGLEFPICFVSGISKRFNMQDTTQRIIPDIEFGIGTDFTDPEIRLKEATLCKRVIQEKSAMETVGEALRLLYVALTRAEEKLIITGTIEKPEKVLAAKLGLTGYKKPEEQLPFTVLNGSRSFFDFLMPALANHPAMTELLQQLEIDGHACVESKARFSISMLDISDMMSEEIIAQTDMAYRQENIEALLKSEDCEADKMVELEQTFSYQYPYESMQGMVSKLSVSELKKHDYLEAIQQEYPEETKLYEEEIMEPYLPSFMKKEETSLGGAAVGSLYHKLLELYDFKILADKEAIQSFISLLQTQKRLTEQETQLIQVKALVKFMETKLARRMHEAALVEKLRKEQPFVIKVNAAKVNEQWPSEEFVLVQGIVDVFFEEDGELVLADYKTDRVSSSEALIKRYRIQLEYYAAALEQLTGKKVKEKIIYSFALQKEILL